jgi:hypothetical protein
VRAVRLTTPHGDGIRRVDAGGLIRIAHGASGRSPRLGEAVADEVTVDGAMADGVTVDGAMTMANVAVADRGAAVSELALKEIPLERVGQKRVDHSESHRRDDQ